METRPDIPTMIRVFGRIGITSFGGPAAQIALMHEELVDRQKWLSEKEFLSALSFCMLLPGPEAMQLATYCGWRLRGQLGGLIAGLLFVLPGALVIWALAMVYAAWGALPMVQTVFLGIKATVVVIVLQALFKLSKKALNGPAYAMIAVLSFVGIYALGLPFPLIVLAAGLWGATTARADIDQTAPRPSGKGTTRTALIWLCIWGLPFPLIWISDQSLLIELARFFSTLAIVTFGGAYAVLAYMTQTVVQDFGWLTTAEMIDALGLAETTPGPLILVTEFVGILTGHKFGGSWYGTIAGLVVLWVTFAPCFLWIFVGAPYLTWISTRPRISHALSAISAAVVGVIFSLSLWFAFHVFFTDVSARQFGWLSLDVPAISSYSALAILYAGFAAVLLLGLKRSILTVLLITAALSLIIGNLV